MATNPLFQSPANRLNQAATDTNQQGWQAWSKGLEQQGTAQIGTIEQNTATTIQSTSSPDTQPSNRGAELSTPNTSKLAADGLATARGPEPSALPDTKKAGTAAQPLETAKLEGNGEQQAAAANPSPGFSGWLSRQAGEYMQNKIQQAGQGVGSNQNSSTQNSQSTTTGPVPQPVQPQRPEAQTTKGGPLSNTPGPESFNVPNTDNRPQPKTDWTNQLASQPKIGMPKINRPKF
jgi:hypothetical protein